jgi:hypothetical protein
MSKAERAIDPVDFTSIQRTKDFINSLPNDVRVCPEHGEPVVIQVSGLSLNSGASPPFDKAAFTACCDAALKRVTDAIAMHSLRR